MSKMAKAVKFTMKSIKYRMIKRSTYLCSRLNHFRAFYFNKKQETVIIVFLVYIPQAWNSMKSVYQAAKKTDGVRVYVVVTPGKFISGDRSVFDPYVFFSSECPGAIKAEINGDFFDIRTLKPDIVFRQTPYDDQYPVQYSLRNISKYSKTCYIPYNYNFSPKKHLEIEYKDSFLANMYAVFSESESNYNYCKDKSKYYKDLKVFYLGFPRFDLLRERNMFGNAGKLPRKSKSFTWIPRWSVDTQKNDGTSFFEYKEKLIDLFRKNHHLSLIIRPHPSMFNYFIKNGIISEQELDDFYRVISEQDNIFLDHNIDYLDTFEETDVLIADMSSINYEFYLTGKPLIYCGDTKEYNSETKNMMDLIYKVDKWEKLEMYILRLANGDDEIFDKRMEDVCRSIKSIPDKCGERIIITCREWIS